MRYFLTPLQKNRLAKTIKKVFKLENKKMNNMFFQCIVNRK